MTEDPALRLGPRRAAGHLAAALGLIWRSARFAGGVQLALALVAGAGPVAMAWLTKLLVDRLTGETAGSGTAGSVTGLAVALAAVGVLVAGQPLVSKYYSGTLERALRREVTGRLVAAVNSFAGLGRLEEPRFRDRLQLAHDAGRMAPSQCVTGGVGAAQGTLTMAGFAASLLVLAPAMLGIVALAAVPTALVHVRLNRKRAAMTWRIGHAGRREFFYQQLISSLEAAKEIRLFGLGDFFAARLLRELAHIHREQQAMDRRELRGQAGLTLLGAGIAAGGLVWAIVAAFRGQFTVGEVTLFIAAVAGVQGAIGNLVLHAGTVHQALLLFDHYHVVVSAPPDLPSTTGSMTPASLRHGIELRDVWFRYADDQPWVLRGVDLVIPSGSAVALVGLNGAGKSTLVKLLCRFYDPVRGSISWDGTDLREIDVKALRDRLSVVFQDFMCYDLTARENIELGDLAKAESGAGVEMAAGLAGCHDTLAELPKGYDTMLSRLFFDSADQDDPENGVLLSGGQWQRLAVARAMFRDRRELIVLDEPSAGLDAEAEHQVHTRLRELRRGRTSVLISHRLSTVRDANRIVVLADGRITECGSHDELMELRGTYAALFEKQAEGYQLSEAR